MAIAKVVDGLHCVSSGGVNVYLLDAPEGLTLIDTGYSTTEPKIAAALRTMGRSVADLRHIVLTHAHVDHIGSLAALATASGATTYMHEADVPIAESGGPFRPLKPSPELLGAIIYKLVMKPDATVAPARIDRRVEDGDILPIAGGLRAIHVPGALRGAARLPVAGAWRAVRGRRLHEFARAPPADRVRGPRGDEAQPEAAGHAGIRHGLFRARQTARRRGRREISAELGIDARF